MTRQLTATAEAKTEPMLVLRQSVPEDGTQQVTRPSQRGNDSAATAAARRPSCPNCSHHWIIEVALGPLSKGICKRCGEEQLFRNQFQWAEIAPPRVVNSRRQTNDSMNIPEQTGDYSPLLLQSRHVRPVALESAGRGY